MPTKIQMKRGLNSRLNSLTLSTGEPAFVTDTGKLYIGGSSGKVLINPDIPEPAIKNCIFAYYEGTNLSVAASSFIALNNSSKTGTAVSLSADGTVNLNQSGTYFITYSVTSNSTDASTALYNPTAGGFWPGSACHNTSSLLTPFTTCSGFLIRTITTAEKLAIKNNGTASISVVGSNCSLTVIKII